MNSGRRRWRRLEVFEVPGLALSSRSFWLSSTQAVEKKDGTNPTLKSVDEVLAKKADNPEWRGEDSSAGGRPRSLTRQQAKELVDLVFKERGSAKVTVPYCRKWLPFLRRVSPETVRQELLRAGLAWLRRRRKTAAPTDWKPKRMSFCRWMLKQKQADLNRYAYTDGTTFYLSKGPSDEQDKRRAALDACVWRMADGKDGLWDENVGPSLCRLVNFGRLKRCRRVEGCLSAHRARRDDPQRASSRSLGWQVYSTPRPKASR